MSDLWNSTKDLNTTLLVIAAVCLFSTDHWIGGSVLAGFLLLKSIRGSAGAEKSPPPLQRTQRFNFSTTEGH